MRQDTGASSPSQEKQSNRKRDMQVQYNGDGFFSASMLDDDVMTDSTQSLILFVDEAHLNKEKLIASTGGYIESELEINGKTFLKMSNVSAEVKQIKNVDGVISVEYDVMRYAFATPNDPRYSAQYAPQITNLETVWDNYTGDGVVVAVIDSGVDTLHEDFGGSTTFKAGKNYATSSVTDYGITDNYDENGHGTHVAGIIGARRNNNKGIVGVAPEATIIPYRATGAGIFSGFSSSNIAAAIKAATDAGADVINMSLGGLQSSLIELEAVNYAIKQKVVVVVAVGNEHGEYMVFPASYPGVIAVGSSNGSDEVSGFSTRTSLISVVGPGDEILSLKTNINGSGHAGYIIYSGTSMAAPFVTGVVALLKQKFPAATPSQIKQILESTAKDIDITGFDKSSGYGRVQPAEALAVTSLPTESWTETEFTISMDGQALSNYMITLLDNNKPYYSMYTDSRGIASAYIPQGTYSFISGYLGAVVFNGDITIGATKTTKTKQFSAAATGFSNYYRVSTVYNENDVDTVMLIYELDVQGSVKSTLTSNDDKASGDIYSEITFKTKPLTKYLIVVVASFLAKDSQKTGKFQVILEKNIFANTPVQKSLSTQNTSFLSPVVLQDTTQVQGEITTKNPYAYYVFTSP